MVVVVVVQTSPSYPKKTTPKRDSCPVSFKSGRAQNPKR